MKSGETCIGIAICCNCFRVNMININKTRQDNYSRWSEIWRTPYLHLQGTCRWRLKELWLLTACSLYHKADDLTANKATSHRVIAKLA